MKHFALLLSLVLILASCKTSKDLAEETPSPSPELTEQDTSDQVSAETEGPKLVVDTVKETTTGEQAKMTNADASSNAENTASETLVTEGDGAYRVQVDATMGSIFKAKYKGFNKLYFEEGPGGSKVFVGKGLSKADAEKLRDEYKLRGFKDAFVVDMKGSGSSAASKFEGTESTKSINPNGGLVYMIQLLAYKGPNPPKQLKKANFFQILGFNDGFKRIYSGTYPNVEAARSGQAMYKKRGFKDCYVVPFEGYKNKLNGMVGEPIK